MSLYGVDSTVRNKFGLPKQVVESRAEADSAPRRALVWLHARDDFEGQLLDALHAYKNGVITRRAYDSERARLSSARWTADQRYRRALKEAK